MLGWFIFLWIICTFGTAYVAKSKGEGFATWLFLGLIFGPLALFFALVRQPNPGLTPVAAPAGERLVLGADNLSVTTDRLLVDGYAFRLADLAPVSVRSDALRGYVIDLRSLSGQNLRTIYAREFQFLDQISTAINQGVLENRPAVETGDARATSGGAYAALDELRRMREAGLISAEEYDAKKQDILTRL